MRIRIDGRDYGALRNLSFAPETDLSGASLPVNAFEAEIDTSDAIEAGQYARLYDDRERLWAKYWIALAERIHPDMVRLRAESDAAVLDGVTLPAVYYSGASVTSVLDETLVVATGAPGIVARMDYAIDGSLIHRTLTGFCPEQTARERLTWILLVLGAQARTAFNECLTILPTGETAALVPPEDTFWRPSVSFGDVVTAIRLKYYAFAPGTPQPTDRWVKDDQGAVYLVTEHALTLSNPHSPADAPENTVSVEGVYLVNADNAGDVANALARWAFSRASVTADVIDNGDIAPGDKLTVYTDEAALRTGWVRRAEFRFGVQARARLELLACEAVAAGRLRIVYRWADFTLNTADYTFPVGYGYAVENPWFDQSFNGCRRVFRPLEPAAEGTVTAQPATVYEDYAPALAFTAGVLEIISVDGLTADGGTVQIA